MSRMAKAIASAFVLTAAMSLASSAIAGSSDKEIKIIHMGDVHGHTVPRANVRSDGDGKMEGGLARMYTKIKDIRGKNTANTLLINTGDTLQGSGEALYSKGQALVDVLDYFGINNYVPGNWDFVYGPDRFKELFVNADPSKRRWGGLVSNLYVADAAAPALADANGVITQASSDAYNDFYLANGVRLLPPYEIKTINSVKVGIIGCTTNRGPQVVGKWVTEGLAFTDCAKEIPKYAAEVRPQVDLLILISEIEIGRNIQNVKASPGIDLVLNSDMHEETSTPIQITHADGTTTLIVEEGQDGTMLGEIEYEFSKNAAGKYVVKEWEWKAHRISDAIAEDKTVADKVKTARKPYTTGFTANTHLNVFSETYLIGSLDTVVGTTKVDLHRSGYSDDAVPAVIEGSSHDFIADAVKWWAQSDLATVCGFRYSTQIKAGSQITRGDLYHYVPIGPRVGKASRINPNQLRNQIDNSSLTVLSSDPNNPLVEASPSGPLGWAGGWMFAYSGPTFSFDPYYERIAGSNQSRSRSIKATLPCARLPVAEQAACNATGLGVAQTEFNNNQASKNVDGTKNTAAGAWNTNWNADISVAAYDLTPSAWTFAAVTVKKQNGMPTASVSGYWYAKNPDTINNCGNCIPRGTSNVVDNAEAPYLLPVNMDPATGGPMLEVGGMPKLQRDANGVVLRDSTNHPLVAGTPIELTEVIEKYLAATGDANPVYPRITLVNPLPGRASNNGVPFMQPLCGTIGKDPLGLYICP